MKKLVFSVAMIAAFVGAMMTSCKKEKETVMSEKVQTEVNDPQNDAIVNRILDFKNKVDERKLHPGTRSGETMTLEEAMNNVVDLFNVTYTEPMACYTASESHKFSINVPLTVDGKVLVDDVIAAYEQVVANASEAYHASPLASKGYRRLMVTCEMQRDGDASLNFDGNYGSKGTTPPNPHPHFDGPFSEGDDWHYKDGMGSCDGTRPGGADKVLQDAIMEEVRSLWPADPNDGRGFYTDFVTDVFSGADHTGVFYSTDVDETCIGWQYMNDYLAGEINNIFQVVPQELGISLDNNPMLHYRYFVTDVVIDGTNGLDGNHISYITQQTNVEYGRYHYIGNGTIERQEL